MIETKRLILRPLTAAELNKHMLSPKKLAHELGLLPACAAMNKETHTAMINDLLPNVADPHKNYLFNTLWLVIEKSSSAIAGGFCFHGEPNAAGEVEIGYGMDKKFRNKGYMTETISGLVDWVKKFTPVKIIKAETKMQNIPSFRVLEKNGFKLYQQTDNTVIFKLDVY